MIKVKNKKAVAALSEKSRKANKTRNIVAIIAIALTALLFTSLFTMGMGTAENLQRSAMRQAGGDGHAALKYLNQEQFDAVKDNPAIDRIAFNMALCDGVENEALLKRRAEFWYNDKTGLELGFVSLSAGRLPEAEDEIIADSKTLQLLGVPLELGAPVDLELNIRGENVTRHFVLSGWWQSDPVFNVGQIFSSRAYVDAHADELQCSHYDDLSFTGAINAYVMFKSSSNLQGKLDKLLMESGFSSIESEPNYISSNVNWSYLSTNFNLDGETVIALGLGLALIILTGYLIIYNIFQISVVKDIRFYGLLKTIGTTERQIRFLVRRQALVLSAMGIPLGLLLGFFCGSALVPTLMQNTDYAGSTVSVTPNPYIFVGAAVFALITVFISTQKPARMAGKVSPIEAIRYTDGENSGKAKEKRSLNGAKMERFALSNLGRNKKRTALVIISLSLCLILLAVVATLSNSIDMDKYLVKFNDTDFQIAHADYFNNEFYGHENAVSPDLIDAVQALDGFESGGTVYGGCENMVFVEDPAFTADYNISEYGDPIAALQGLDGLPLERLELIDGEIDIEKLLSGDYILEGVHTDDNGRVKDEEIHHKVGDKITLHFYEGEGDTYEGRKYAAKEFTVLGHVKIKYYSNTDRSYWDYTYFLPTEAYKQVFPNPAAMCYCFNVADDKESAAEDFLKQYTDSVEPLMNYTSKAASKAEFEQMKNTVLMIGGALSIIIGLIGILNFINAVLTGIISRRKEFAMLQSIGMTRAQLKKMLCYEGLYYGAGAGLFSAALGVLVSSVIVRSFCNLMWFMSFKPVYWPLAAAIPVLLVLGLVIPTVIYSASDKESIVERLREAE